MKTPVKLIITALSISIITLFYLHFSNSTKLVVVDSTKIIANYEGMKQAQSSFQAKAVTWQANIDTLGKELQESLMNYEENLSSMSKKEKELSAELLKAKQQQFRQYQEAISQKAEQEEMKAQQAILEEINAYLKIFGQENGYQIILATTEMVDIAYADEAIDVTDQVIEGLNKEYLGQL